MDDFRQIHERLGNSPTGAAIGLLMLIMSSPPIIMECCVTDGLRSSNRAVNLAQ